MIITFMFEPAKLQMNWAKASGINILRNAGAIVCCSGGLSTDAPSTRRTDDRASVAALVGDAPASGDTVWSN